MRTAGRRTTTGWVLTRFTAVLLAAAASTRAATAPTLALIEGIGDRQAAPAVRAEIETALLKDAGFTLVDREAITKILREHELAAAELTARQNRVQLGQLVPADVLLFLQTVPASKPPLARLTLTESRTGIVLNEWLWDNERVIRSAAVLLKEVKAAADKRDIPLKDRHLIGLLEFRGEESGLGLDSWAGGLGELVMYTLGRLPSVMVLDREHLEHLRTERELTPLDQQLVASVRLLECGFRRKSDKGDLTCTISLRALGRADPLISTVNVKYDDPAGAQEQIASVVAGLLKAGVVPAE